MSVKPFPLQGDYIELIQLLKATGLCSTGGMAKAVVEDGLVRVDGAVELRKRFKVRRGHKVQFEKDVVEVG